MNYHISKRHSIRLSHWDYSSAGYYFVTVCTFHRQNLFDNPQFYDIAAHTLLNLSSLDTTKHINLDAWVVMPNHVHAILLLTPPSNCLTATTTGRAGSLGAFVGQYKAIVTTRVNLLRRRPQEKVWQRGYYERIIRTEREWRATQKYIIENPIRWAEDRDNLDKLIGRMASGQDEA